MARAHGAVADRTGVQEVQLAIAAKPDAVDVGFWRAVLGYAGLDDDNAVDPFDHIQVGGTPQGGGDEILPRARQLALVTPPCATAAPASEALVVDRNAIGMSFGFPAQQIYGHVSEVLTLYRPGGAAQYMSELTAALPPCATNSETTRTVAAKSFAGDESVLILSTFQGSGSMQVGQTPIPVPSSSYRAVIRADDVVMVLEVGPLESGLTQRETNDTMIDIAIKRAEK
jgi:hypothetical protein